MQVKDVTWVVYRKTIHKRPDSICAVCQQSEWDAMELARPGYHHLVRAGIPTEVEAEMVARSEPTAGPATEAQARPSLGSTDPDLRNTKSSQEVQ